MKRFWTILLAMVMAMALVIAIPAGAVKPCCETDEVCESLGLEPTPEHQICTTTTTEPSGSGFPDCNFTGGVLDGWRGGEDNRQCVWHVDRPGDEFEFQIQQDPDSTVDVENVLLPVLIVNVDYVFPSDKCFLARERGPQMVPFPSEGDDLWTFTPGKIGCGEGPYLLTISALVKSGSVILAMTQTPPPSTG